MKAIVYTEYGSPDVLHLKEVEKPVPRIMKCWSSSCGIRNGGDLNFLKGDPFLVRPFPDF